MHRLTPGHPLWVAGLLFSDEPAGLEGHSDGDVVAHAACDALLSAAGLGDLGSNYGTDRPEWRGASGVAFLTETAARVRAAGYEIANVAVQLIGNRPRFAQRRTEAESVLTLARFASLSSSCTPSFRWTSSRRTWWAVALRRRR